MKQAEVQPLRLTWFKSSYSAGSSTDCVETARQDGMLVRDSKDPHGPNFSFTPAAWASFIAAVKAGRV